MSATTGELSGTVLGRYRVGRLLGSGGMGSVYAGVHEPLGRPVAIKVLRGELTTDAGVLRRFRREAELAASLSHPNIVQVTDFDVDAGRAFLVMDLLEGESLATRIAREGRLPSAAVARVATQVLAALAAAHARGVVHRDLKPENVFVQYVSGMEIVKLLDFGIARVLDADARLTGTGAVLGTPAYMSPEQARGKPVDPRSDLFSLGAMLYEASVGRRPFEGSNYHELMFAIVEGEASPLDATVHAGLRAIIERAMAKDPDARFASANEMRAAIDGLDLAPDDSGTTTPRDRSAAAFAQTMASEPERAPARRGLAPAVAFAVIATLGAGALAMRLLEPTPAPSPAPTVTVEATVADAALPPDPVDAAVFDAAVFDAGSLPEVAEELEVVPTPAARPRAAATVALCGPDRARVELAPPRSGQRVRATGSDARGGARWDGSMFGLLSRVNERAAEATACWRSHPMMRGQAFLIHVDAEGRNTGVDPIAYCPVDPGVVGCMRRALAQVPLTNVGGAPGSYRVSFDRE